MRPPALVLALLCLIVSPAVVSPAWAQRLDETPRVAVISAFPPEIGALNAATSAQKTFDVHGVQFTTGTLEGKPFKEVVDMTFDASGKRLAIRAETFAAGVSTSTFDSKLRK